MNGCITALMLLPMLLTFSSSAFATRVDYYFEKLKEVPADYQTFGTTCEYVAQEMLWEQFDKKSYEIKVGIVYRNDQRIIGELDIVIFDRETQEAILIGEVKCRKNLSNAYRHAREQLQRFQDTINHTLDLELYLDSNRSVHYAPDRFDEYPEKLTIAQEGSEQAGFGLALDLNLAEVTELRARLLRCQRKGYCPK